MFRAMKMRAPSATAVRTTLGETEDEVSNRTSPERDAKVNVNGSDVASSFCPISVIVPPELAIRPVKDTSSVVSIARVPVVRLKSCDSSPQGVGLSKATDSPNGVV